MAAALVAFALTWLVPVDATHAQTVSMGRPGDHWASMLAWTHIGRGERNGVYGYEVKLRAADGCEVELFYPRGAIDFQGKGRTWRSFKVRVKTGWLYYPSRLNARSLPRVHPGVLEIEDHYVRQADGAIAAAQGFAIVATLGTVTPAPRPAPLPRATRPAPAPRTATASRTARARATSAGTASAARATPAMQRMLQSMSKSNLKHSIRHLPEFQKLDPKMTAQSLRELGARIATDPKNLISSPGAVQQAFQQVVRIGGVEVPVRAVLNRARNLHNIHIRY